MDENAPWLYRPSETTKTVARRVDHAEPSAGKISVKGSVGWAGAGRRPEQVHDVAAAQWEVAHFILRQYRSD